MTPILKCAHCGAEYHADHAKHWGKHQDSVHAGPIPVCTALVEDHLGSGALCRGPLYALAVDAKSAESIARPRPIAL